MRDESYTELSARVAEIDCMDVNRFQAAGGILIDVRETNETAHGYPRGAQHLPKSTLELKIHDFVANYQTPIALICGSGQRSRAAAVILTLMGFTDVASVHGGVKEWRLRGLEFECPGSFTTTEAERYARHLVMPSVGVAGQGRLKQSKVLVVGAGGLGSPAALYLAAAGVGTIGLVDADIVERSNLQRQILHSEHELGWPKVASGAQRLRQLNPDIAVHPFPNRLTADNVLEIASDFDVVLDGTDNLETRAVLNRACVALGIPYIYGAVFQFEGQVGVFTGGIEPNASCYACFQPAIAPSEVTPSCAEAGVLGVLPGIVGSLQALEAIKYLLGIESGLIGRIGHLDGKALGLRSFTVPRAPACQVCGGSSGR